MKIFDRLATLFAAKPTAPPPRTALFTETAVNTMLADLFGLADPDAILQKAGKTRADLRALEGDDEISAALDTRRAVVTSTPWRLEPYDERAKFIEAELRPHLEATIESVWAAVPYGYSVIEAVYAKRDDGRTGVAQLTEKPFEWFLPGIGGTLKYLAFGSGPVVVDTTAKFFLTVNRYSYRNPRGEALLSRAYWPWFLRSAGWRFFARFVERHAGPLLIGKTDGDKGKFADSLAAAVQSGALAIDRNDEVEAVAAGDGGKGFELFIELSNKRIQKLILGQTLTTDTGGVGSQALGKVHDQVRMDRKASDLRMVRKTMQRIVDALYSLNFADGTPPTFVLESGRDIQTERATRDAQLTQAGVVKLTERYLLDRYDFEPGDFTVPPSAPAGAPPVKASERFAARGGGRIRFTADQQALEDLAAEAEREAGDPIDPKAIRAAIRESSSPEELIEKLAHLFEALPPDDYRETMERAIFAADVMGYAHAAQDIRQ